MSDKNKFPNKTVKSNLLYTMLANRFNLVIIPKSEYDDLNLFKDSNTGLYAIDKNPKDVDYKWILKYNFRIT
jgi:hypothetical protein